MRPGQHPAAGDINEAMLGELDQEFDMLAPEQKHAASWFAADELGDLLNKVRCNLATADVLCTQISRPGPCEPSR